MIRPKGACNYYKNTLDKHRPGIGPQRDACDARKCVRCELYYFVCRRHSLSPPRTKAIWITFNASRRRIAELAGVLLYAALSAQRS